MGGELFSINRYYELRHELESDFHNDYLYANAVAYGEIDSIAKKEDRVLEVIAKHTAGTGTREQYDVLISYVDGGDIVNSDNSSSIGCWFDEKPELNATDVSFDCCVFDTPLSLKGYKSIRFLNCFFLDSVSIEDCPECYAIRFEHCAFKRDLMMSKCSTDDLFIRNCNVFESVSIDDCVVGKWTSIHDVRIRLALHFWDSVFSGHEFLLNKVKNGYGMEVRGSVFEAPTRISLCSLEEIRVDECNFSQLTVRGIFTHRYMECEELVDSSSEKTTCSEDCESCIDAACGFTPRER